MGTIRKDDVRALIAPPVHERSATDRLVREMNRLGAAPNGRQEHQPSQPSTQRG